MKADLLYAPGIAQLHLLALERQHLGEPPCYDGHAEDWHPSTEAERRDTERAKALCASCPILAECHAYALANPDMAGYWGGTCDIERDELRKKEKAA